MVLVALFYAPSLEAASSPSLSSIYPQVEGTKSGIISTHSGSSSPFIFSFPSQQWNLIGDSENDGVRDNPLAGWQSVDGFSTSDAFNASDAFNFTDAFDMADSFNSFYLYGQSSVEFSKGVDSETSEKIEESYTAIDGKSCYHYSNLKSDAGGLFIAKARHEVSGGGTVDARVLLSSENGRNSDFFVADITSPARTTQLGIGANVGKLRVWGEFQMNDWNGLGSSMVPVYSAQGAASPDVASSALSSSDAGGIASPFDNSLITGRTAFEVGASFPASNVRGAVRYRKSFDDENSSGGLSRQHLGIEGEVKIEDDVYFKAGYERVNSVTSVSQQNESNLWTGIEVNF